MASNNEDSTIPLDAENILFAVDLVANCMKGYFPDAVRERGLKIRDCSSFRHLVNNRFRLAFEKAVEAIDVDRAANIAVDLLELDTNGELDISSLLEYSDNFKSRYSLEEYHAETFLMYAVDIVHFSKYMYAREIDDAPDVAVELIARALPENMSDEKWDELISLAEIHAKIQDDLDALKPPPDNHPDSDEEEDSDEGYND